MVKVSNLFPSAPETTFSAINLSDVLRYQQRLLQLQQQREQQRQQQQHRRPPHTVELGRTLRDICAEEKMLAGGDGGDDGVGEDVRMTVLGADNFASVGVALMSNVPGVLNLFLHRIGFVTTN